MANTKIECCINLAKCKAFIRQNKAGEPILYFDVIPNFNGQTGKYGETHSVQIYRDGQKHYIGNGTEKEFGAKSAPSPVSAPSAPVQVAQANVEPLGDLPF